MSASSDPVHGLSIGSAEAEVSGQASSSGKQRWQTPAIEEVPFTRTEAGGIGAVYDLTVYTGSR